MVVLLVLPPAVGAIALGAGALPLPYELDLVRQQLPLVFPLHMVASGAALILIPIAAATRRGHRVHRIVGRAAAVAVVLGGTTALAVAFASEATVPARAGFVAQALVWLVLLTHAVVAIRRGDVARHAQAMLGVAAVASGAIWLRLVLAAAIAARLPFDTAYAVAAWACWMLPLAVVVSWRGQGVAPMHRRTRASEPHRRALVEGA